MKLIIAVLVLTVIVGLCVAVRRSLAKKRGVESQTGVARSAARDVQSTPGVRSDRKAGDPGTERVPDSRFDGESLAAPDDEDDGKYWRRYYR